MAAILALAICLQQVNVWSAPRPITRWQFTGNRDHWPTRISLASCNRAITPMSWLRDRTAGLKLIPAPLTLLSIIPLRPAGFPPFSISTSTGHVGLYLVAFSFGVFVETLIDHGPPMDRKGWASWPGDDVAGWCC